ncbi:MAG: ABC transporter ATP-binding protein [Oscillospiraceae bacterium]|jgi:putative ABC transport system ATP-binding protein|nr:ABC transporter ATP-binding protein [Oscillospiraceae bacterium]
MSILSLQSIGFSYAKGQKILHELSYEFGKGKVYAIIGRSGAGKTTLLSLLSGLVSPTEGSILFDGKDVRKIDRYKYRSHYVGVIFQQFNLLPHLTAVENVELSIRASGKKISEKRKLALELLEKVGLDDELAKRRILKLSGGEQQRVAIARALSYDPDIILADEPTGNLDLTTQDEIMGIFTRLAHEENKCVIIVSHSPEVARSVDDIYELAPLKSKKEIFRTGEVNAHRS